MKLVTSRSARPLRRFAAMLIVGTAVGFSLPAMARYHGGGGDDMSAMEFNERMLDSVGVSADQKTQIKAIFKSARSDISGQKAFSSSLRAQALQNFAATTVDANAAESLRQQLQAQKEAASKRMLQATVAAANVLTPAQRQSIAAKITERLALAQKQRDERQALYQPAR